MSLEILEFNLKAQNREEIRKELIGIFMSEKPGTGNGNLASRYRYNVERFSNYEIFLSRPTTLNKGFDFKVNVDTIYFEGKRKHKSPSHKNIFDSLNYCKEETSDNYIFISDAIKQIYECRDFDKSKIYGFFPDRNNELHPIQIILLALKWLFIEQDCAYWNYSGRRMLYEGLLEDGLIFQ